MLPEWGWVTWTIRRARWVQVFARLKPGYTVEVGARRRCRGLFTQIREYEMTLPGGEGLVGLRARAVHEGTHARRDGRDGLFRPAQRLLDRADRADVHGRPGAADRLRATSRTC